MPKAPRKPKLPPRLTVAQFAILKGCTRQAVLAAIERGDIPPAVTCWTARGKQKVLMIVDVPTASKLWTPAAQPAPPTAGEMVAGPLSGSSSLADARRLMAIARAKQAQLEFEVASGKSISLDEAISVVTRRIAEARDAFLALPNRLRNRLPGVTVETMEALDQLVRETLDNLAETPRQIEKLARPGKGKRS
jgi:phage terminase Nu1 subunit (DNA packaging protein)